MQRAAVGSRAPVAIAIHRGVRHHLEARGLGPTMSRNGGVFQRMVWRTLGPTPVQGFMIKLPDGTCARIMAGEVTHVWIEGERPPPDCSLPSIAQPNLGP